MSCEQVARDLDAYLDRELDTAAAAAVRDHLSGCATCHQRAAERDAVGRLVRTAPYWPAPDRLRQRVMAQTTRSRLMFRAVTWSTAAAAVVLFAAGTVALLRPTATRGDVVDQVVDGHVRSLMADHLFDVQSTDQHTVKPWFLGKLDFAPPVVDLAAKGFPLVGGRLDYLAGRPVAALVYRRQKHTINVFVAAVPDDTSPSAVVRSARGFHVHHWSRGGMSFWAVSDLNETELAEFEQALRQ